MQTKIEKNVLFQLSQKRATVRTQDYFYHPLVNTPFTLGIVLPRDYGRFRVNGKIEVSLTEYNSKFVGEPIFNIVL